MPVVGIPWNARGGAGGDGGELVSPSETLKTKAPISYSVCKEGPNPLCKSL
jgi:hypothetical protein